MFLNDSKQNIWEKKGENSRLAGYGGEPARYSVTFTP
jgi:hypothetical protein